MSSWVTPEYIRKLEAAAEFVLSSHWSITQQQRQESEDTLLSFRRSVPNFNECRALLENTTNETVLHQAIIALRECVLRLWNYTAESERSAVQDFTLSYILNHLSGPSHLIQLLTHALAIMMKLGAVKKDAKSREYVHQFLQNLVLRGNPKQQRFACTLISNLMTEFAINSKSSSMGISIEDHWQCKKQFEAFDLKMIFSLTLEVVKMIVSMEMTLSKDMYHLICNFLDIFHHLLRWSFTSVSSYSKRSFFVMADRDKTPFEPPSDWESVVLNYDNIHLIFTLNDKCRVYEELSRVAVSCVAQIASLQGKIVGTDEKKTLFLGLFVKEFLRCYGSRKFYCFEALGIADICGSLVENFKVEIWGKTAEMQRLCVDFVEGFKMITCTALAGAVEEEKDYEDNQIYLDSFEVLLNAWTTLAVSSLKHAEFFIPASNTVFEHYVKWHILQPEGWRPLVQIEGEIDELVEHDRERFSSHLTSIAALARLSLGTTLPAIISLLQSRISVLENDLDKIKKSSSALDESYMENLFEDIHWLMLIANAILSDDCEGQTPVIPPEIMQFSIAQRATVDLKLTLQVLGSPQSYHQLVANSPANSLDLSVHLVALMLRLCHVSQEAASVNLLEHLSPEILSDLLYFLLNWARTYLFFDESCHDEVSPVFFAAYGRDSDGAKWCVDYALNFVCSVLRNWAAEKELLSSAADVLAVLVMDHKRCKYVTSSEAFWRLGHGICAGDSVFRDHPPKIKQQIVTSVVIVGTSNMNLYRERYWEQTMALIAQRYQIGKVDIISGKADNSETLNEFLLLLDLFCGVAEGSKPENTAIIFNFLSQLLSDAAKIIETCHCKNRNVVISILLLFSIVAHEQSCYLPELKFQSFYEWTLSALKSYTKVSQTLFSRDVNEQKYEDLCVIFELLSHLLDRDIINFSDLDEPKSLVVGENANKVEACDVALYGLGCIFPNVDQTFLSYPSMRDQYFKLICDLCDLHPGKVATLPADVFHGIIESLKQGLVIFGIDICKLCIDSVSSMFSHCRENPSRDGILHNCLPPFVKLTFDAILMYASDMELLQSACNAFYCMYHQNPDNVNQLFGGFVKRQQDDTQKERLIAQFRKLTVTEPYSRAGRVKFTKILEEIVFDVRGVLWVK